MSYDVIYYEAGKSTSMDRDVEDFDTPQRNKMLLQDGRLAAAIWTDHPARPEWHWNGREWIEGRLPDSLIQRRRPA